MPAANREIAELRKQVRELTARLAELGGDEADDMSDRANEFVSRAKDKADEWVDALRREGFEMGKRAKHMAKHTDEYVHENAWMVAAGALAVGLVTGFFLSRRD